MNITPVTRTDVIPIAVIGQYEKEGVLHPAAKILNEEQNVAFDPMFLAASMITLYEAFLSHVPESKQIDFEEQFKYYLKNMLEVKDQFTIKFDDQNN